MSSKTFSCLLGAERACYDSAGCTPPLGGGLFVCPCVHVVAEVLGGAGSLLPAAHMTRRLWVENSMDSSVADLGHATAP